ncbi:hypothetical protein PBV52_46210 [Streptomyces sp. T12]|uniref:hypothetical protein n=1 Tax=Streptomyces sp. T12 TaxID=477697 RepID=UPI00236636C5|nr:hypothetical protein [Streptomyces sp. T12]WDF43656.1 hypothetical protein PBV52_46210 [Streptomyces sp. T12]
MGVDVQGDPHIGRLRKSVKVEKAIVTEGRVSDAADDHTEEAFIGHYAQGTTLRILSGRTIATAQQHWFDKALERADGPTLVSEGQDIDPDLLQEAGLSALEAEDIMSGQLDMRLSLQKPLPQPQLADYGSCLPGAVYVRSGDRRGAGALRSGNADAVMRSCSWANAGSAL